MVRTTSLAFVLALLLGGMLAPAGGAEEKKKAAAPEMASDEDVAEALAEFKEAYKAPGLKGDDRVMQRDFAMRKINKLHHPEVISALGKVSRSSDEDLRLMAVIYLGDQALLPHLAAKYVLGAMKKHKKDVVMQMTGLQSLGTLKYLGASHQIRALLKHKHFVVRKSAITTIGDIGDSRMLADVLKALGVKLESEGGKDGDKKESKKEVTEGASWEGAEAVVDRGESDNSKENADAKRQAEAQIARNKAAATGGGKGGGGAGGGIGIGGSGGRGGSSRSTEELIPTILRTLKKITGEEFAKPSAIRTWVREQSEWIASEKKRLAKLEKAQKAAK